MSLHCSILFLALAYSLSGEAQEVKSIDLTALQPRTELRYPPAPEADCAPSTSCVSGGYAGLSVSDGAPDRRDPHALGVYLLRVTPSDVDPDKPFQAEFRVLNTGLAPIDLPISPHLSDLQPSDASVTFSYLSLALVVDDEGLQLKQLVGFVELYGSLDREGTMLALRPGEWMTVRANIKPHSRDAETTRFLGDFWLRQNVFHPHPGGSFTETNNLYPNKTPTPGIPVRVLHSSSSNE